MARGGWAGALMVAGLLGCDGTTQDSGAASAERNPAGVFVSPPIDAALAPGATDQADTVAFVSAAEGTFAAAGAATVSSRRTGAFLTLRVVAGGFDPAALGARVGDAIAIVADDRPLDTVTVAIKRRGPVRVVRTVPLPQQTDVPLNIRLRVVFSAPVSEASAREAIRVRRGGVEVASTIELLADRPGVVDVVPTELLEPQAEYVLEIGPSASDVAGNQLGEAVVIPFATSPSQPEPPSPPSPPEPPLPPLPPLSLLVGERGWADIGGDQYLASADGQTMVPLPVQVAYNLSFSPDGRQIVYEGRPSLQHAGWQVFVMNADGTNVRQLTTDGSNMRPSWLPGGQAVVYFHSGIPTPPDLGAWIVNVDGTGRRAHELPLPDDWSPGGLQFVYTEFVGTDGGLWVANADGSSRRLLVPDGYEGRWSPAGSLVAFHLQNQLWVMAPDGTGRRLLTPGVGAFGTVWSPDGSQLIYHESDEFGETGRIIRINVDGSGAEEIRFPGAPWNFRVWGWRR